MIIPSGHKDVENARIARWRTTQFREKQEKLTDILRPALHAKHALNWEALIRNYALVQPKPMAPRLLELPKKPQPKNGEVEPPTPIYLEFPAEPDPNDQKYFGARGLYLQEFTEWSEAVQRIEAENKRRYDEAANVIERLNNERDGVSARWQESVERVEAENKRRQDDYNAALELWDTGRTTQEREVTRFKAAYEVKQPEAVEHYCRQVLALSKFRDGSQRDFDLGYVPETRTLVVDHSLPMQDRLVRVKEVKYHKTSDRFSEVFFTLDELGKIYDDILFQICLRTLHELFDADSANALNDVVFNGWLKVVEKGTTLEVKGCLLSVRAAKEEFRKLNLTQTDPKLCFVALGGVSPRNLHSLVTIKPLLTIKRPDDG
jgi:restriction system protein